MPITSGRYATYWAASTSWQRLARRWLWLKASVRTLCARPNRLAPGDTGVGSSLYREFGYWTIRPVAGWRSHRWVTPPTHATRDVPGTDHDAACDWAIAVLGI
jgi:hypothetical protein